MPTTLTSPSPIFISPHIRRLIDLAIDEDQVGFDATSKIFFGGQRVDAYMIAKSELVVSGLGVVQAVLERVDPSLTFHALCEDGQRLEIGEKLGEFSGDATRLLGAERIALNFLQRMSGIATKTAEFVAALDQPNIRIADTRKTLPGYRELDKYAVTCGGGYNHRFGLSGGIMLKDNHIAAASGSIARAVELVRQSAPHTLRVEVEVTTQAEVEQACEAAVEIIMLDNMDLAQMKVASAYIREHAPRTTIEVSGNVTLDRLPELGTLDVDVVSTGAITHSIVASDISMRFETFKQA